MIRRIAHFFIILLLFQIFTYSQTTIYCPPDADAVVGTHSPDANFGTEDIMIVGWDYNDFITAPLGLCYSLVRYNLSQIPAGATITSAKLRLNRQAIAGDPITDFTLQVWSLNDSWNEYTVTSKNKPGITLMYEAIHSSRYFQMDVTPLVQEWVDGSRVNNGVCLIKKEVDTNMRISFITKEHSWYINYESERIWHCLEVTYTGGGPIVPPPTGVTATKGTYPDKIRVSWNSVSGATQYEIYRNTTDNYSTAIKLWPWFTSSTYYYDDSAGIAEGQNYYYWVRARDASSNESAESESDYGYAICPSQSPPTGVTATKGTYPDKIRISWNSVSGASQYEIYRNTTDNYSTAIKLWPWFTSSTYYYDDSAGIVEGQNYYYWVRARNDCGNESIASSSDYGYLQDEASLEDLFGTVKESFNLTIFGNAFSVIIFEDALNVKYAVPFDTSYQNASVKNIIVDSTLARLVFHDLLFQNGYVFGFSNSNLIDRENNELTQIRDLHDLDGNWWTDDLLPMMGPAGLIISKTILNKRITERSIIGSISYFGYNLMKTIKTTGIKGLFFAIPDIVDLTLDLAVPNLSEDDLKALLYYYYYKGGDHYEIDNILIKIGLSDWNQNFKSSIKNYISTFNLHKNIVSLDYKALVQMGIKSFLGVSDFQEQVHAWGVTHDAHCDAIYDVTRQLLNLGSSIRDLKVINQNNINVAELLELEAEYTHLRGMILPWLLAELNNSQYYHIHKVRDLVSLPLANFGGAGIKSLDIALEHKTFYLDNLNEWIEKYNNYNDYIIEFTNGYKNSLEKLQISDSNNISIESNISQELKFEAGKNLSYNFNIKNLSDQQLSNIQLSYSNSVDNVNFQIVNVPTLLSPYSEASIIISGAAPVNWYSRFVINVSSDFNNINPYIRITITINYTKNSKNYEETKHIQAFVNPPGKITEIGLNTRNFNFGERVYFNIDFEIDNPSEVYIFVNIYKPDGSTILGLGGTKTTERHLSFQYDINSEYYGSYGIGAYIVDPNTYELLIPIMSRTQSFSVLPNIIGTDSVNYSNTVIVGKQNGDEVVVLDIAETLEIGTPNVIWCDNLTYDQLLTQVAGREMILVGGNLANPLVQRLIDLGKLSNNLWSGEGKCSVNIISDSFAGNQNAVVIAGFRARDTEVAGIAFATHYHNRKILDNLIINGPDTVNEGTTNNQYNATAYFTDGSNAGVTLDCAWSENSPYAEISEQGELTAYSVTTNQDMIITASYSLNGITKTATKTITIINVNTKILDHILIEGPTEINENSTQDYNCRAYYTDGTNSLVEPSWNENSDYSSISITGLLTTSEVDSDKSCQVSASYTEGAVTKTADLSVTIKDVPVGTPAISSLVPDQGSEGMPVTINGSNFGSTQGTVTFNGTGASITSWGDAQIQTTVPSSATTGPVVVTTSGGTSSTGVTFTVTISEPEININQNGTDIPDGGSFDFGNCQIGNSIEKTFTIENSGGADLTITTPLTITGTNAAEFSITQQPNSPVESSSSTTFKVTFTPSAEGNKSATISITNNDSNEDPFIINLNGNGIISGMPFFDDFEDGDLAGWELFYSQITNTDENFKNGSRSMKLYDDIDFDSPRIKLTLNTTSSRVGFEFYEWTNDFGWDGGSIYQLDTSTEAYSGWRFSFGAQVYTQGNWRYINFQDKSLLEGINPWINYDSDFPNIVPAEVNSWHKIKVEIYGPEGKVRFWYDDVFKGEIDVDPTNDPLKYFYHYISWSSPTGTLNYLDDFLAYDIQGGISQITVTSPNGGESLVVGNSHLITWSSTGTVGNIKIEYSTDNGAVWTEVIGSTPNDGTYEWTVPSTPSTQCLVKISEASDGTPSDTSDAVFTITASVNPPQINLSRTTLFFGTNGSAETKAQSFLISNSGGDTLNWSITDDAVWLSCTPTSGTGTATVTVSIDPTGLSAGTYNGYVTVTDPNATNSPQTISVTLKVYNAGSTSVPFGSFDTPINNSDVFGSIPVTGWALDDIEVEKIEIYREAGSDLAYIGDAVFVEGSRPDVEAIYSTYPLCYRAGWGYMLLTNALPNGGNGTFVLHAIAYDKDGHKVDLGTKTINVDNASSVMPFGAIDSPHQGGEAIGASFVNFGWALTPVPNTIVNGTTSINVLIDGVIVGNATYGDYRSDIELKYPGYNNSDGAGGHFYIDTTTYDNGVHTISWHVRDDASHVSGIGSRFFSIINTSSDSTQQKITSTMRYIGEDTIKDYQRDYGAIRIKRGIDRIEEPEEKYTDDKGYYIVEMREVERVVIELNREEENTIYEGYMKVGNELRRLPIGSTLDRKRGIFYWEPGPGFIGEYELVFINLKNNSKKNIKILIKPKFEKKKD